MPLLRYRPSAPICQFVECFWWSERFEPQTYCEHILPSGRARLVFALHDDPIIYRASGSSDWEAWTEVSFMAPNGVIISRARSPAAR